jgi:Tol biopolymer transport system component
LASDGRVLRRTLDVVSRLVAVSDGEGASREDGRSVAFRTNRDGNADLYGMAAGGSNAINLTRTWDR